MVVMVRQFLDSARQSYMLPAAARTLLAYATAGTIGLVAGVISASGKVVLVAIFAGLITAAAVMSSRKALFWFVIIGGLVVTGAAQLYLPGSKYIRYIVPLAAAGLILHGVMDRIREPTVSRQHGMQGIISWALAFLLVAMVSTAVNWDGLGVAIVGLKGYFQMWVFFFGLVLIRWKREFIGSLPRGILFIAFLQLPFVMHEYFFLVPKRVGLGGGVVPVDVVSGTFGGSLYGGGANAVLAAFLMIVVACLLGLWKHGALSRFKTIVMPPLFLAPVFVNEAKISALYLPLIFIVLFYRDIVARPVRFLAAGGAAVGLLAALLTALTLAHPSGKLHSWSDLINFVVERQAANIDERRDQYNELSRWTALTFWAEQNVPGNPLHILIGHGPGASRVQESGLNLAETLAEKRYGGLKIGCTALSSLLWDTGVLGLVSVLGMFVAAFFSAGRLSAYYHQQSDPFRAGLFDGLRAGICVLMLSLAHKDFFVFNIPYQTLVLLILGYLVVNVMQVRESQDVHREVETTLS